MAYEEVPAVQAVLDVFPEKKKDGFDRVMDVAHLIMDGTVGTVCSTIDSVFQTYALIQGRRDARRIVKFTSSLEETKVKAAVELRKLDLESQKLDNQYKLQNKVLTLYVDRQYQNTVDQISKSFHQASRNIEDQKYNAIREIDRYTQSVTAGMDMRYGKLLREEEMVCGAYREMLHDLNQKGISKIHAAETICGRIIDNTDRLNDERFALLINVVDKMLEPDFVSFEEYIKMRNDFSWRIV